MRIVSFTDVLEAKYGIREAIRMNKEAGFEGLDYYDMSERACGDGYLEYEINEACNDTVSP